MNEYVHEWAMQRERECRERVSEWRWSRGECMHGERMYGVACG